MNEAPSEAVLVHEDFRLELTAVLAHRLIAFRANSIVVQWKTSSGDKAFHRSRNTSSVDKSMHPVHSLHFDRTDLFAIIVIDDVVVNNWLSLKRDHAFADRDGGNR